MVSMDIKDYTSEVRTAGFNQNRPADSWCDCTAGTSR